MWWDELRIRSSQIDFCTKIRLKLTTTDASIFTKSSHQIKL